MLGEETPYEVPLWIIIVAAVAGILLLGIISLILWKVFALLYLINIPSRSNKNNSESFRSETQVTIGLGRGMIVEKCHLRNSASPAYSSMFVQMQIRTCPGYLL